MPQGQQMSSQEYFPPPTLKFTLAMTPHIRYHLHTEALQLTLETAADSNLDQHTNQLRKPHTKIHHDPEDPTVIHTLRETQGSQQIIHTITISVIWKRTQTI